MFKKEINYSINKNKYNFFNEEIASLVKINSQVLDIGCSTGKLAQGLKNKGCTVVGVDIDEASLRKAAKYCQKIHKIDLDDLDDFDKKLKGNKFDFITCSDILEHLKYPGVLLFHLHKYLKPGGIIIASVPNSAFAWMRFKFLIGDFTYNEKGGLMDGDHLRFFSFNTAKLLFKDAQYKVLKMNGSTHGISNWKYWFIRHLAKVFPTLFATHIIIIAQER